MKYGIGKKRWKMLRGHIEEAHKLCNAFPCLPYYRTIMHRYTTIGEESPTQCPFLLFAKTFDAYGAVCKVCDKQSVSWWLKLSRRTRRRVLAGIVKELEKEGLDEKPTVR